MAYKKNKYKRKYRKPVNKKIIILIASIVFVVGAIVALFLTGIISVNLPGRETEEKVKTSLGYVSFMNSFFVINSDGVVSESRLEQPVNMPKINGLKFNSIIVGQKADPENAVFFDYVVKVISGLKKNSIAADEIYITSDGQISIYVKNLKILFGYDDKTDEKISDLRDFYDKAENLNGTLDMQEYSSDNIGYTFKSAT